MLRLLLVQSFAPGNVVVRQVPDTRRVRPDVERLIDQAWHKTLARPGVRLYDGPICRFEHWQVDGKRLTVDLSRTSYRVFVGTNFCNPHFADLYSTDVMANALGVSTGLLTADGFWMMGRRNASVAYYPNRVHPFAGSIELTEQIDLFANAERELREELHLTPGEIVGTTLVGLVEDTWLRHPESIFMARTTRDRAAVTAGLDADEHDGVWSVANEADAVAEALTLPDLTPVARSVLLLGGKQTFGDDWFDAAKACCLQTD
ncbi:MAG TPA: hypothetical protein VF595_03790 [Tepidisphaeraceae bacterium]|jgi:8-oxo-dGTP pyrophosphatase MutT (NUDIX family)